MSLNDWTQYGQTGEISLDDSDFTEGNASLRFADMRAGNSDSGAWTYVILDESQSAAPTEAQIVTKAKVDSTVDYESIAGYWFRHVDNDNWYHFDMSTWTTVDDRNGVVQKMVNGSMTYVGGTGEATGIGASSGYELHRVNMWIDTNSDLRFRFEVSTDGGSTWSQAGSDVVDTSPSHGGGGGIGLGTNGANPSVPGHYDETEVYW